MFWNIEAIVQTAFVVNDLDREIGRWSERGAGPFLTYKDIEVPIQAHGRDVTLKLSIALGQFDGVQIELIQQHDRQPSVFTDAFPDSWPEGDDGFHHLGMISSDFDRTFAKLSESGYVLAMSGEFGGYRFAFFDAREKLGFFYEIWEGNDALRAFFDDIKRGKLR